MQFIYNFDKLIINIINLELVTVITRWENRTWLQLGFGATNNKSQKQSIFE